MYCSLSPNVNDQFLGAFIQNFITWYKMKGQLECQRLPTICYLPIQVELQFSYMYCVQMLPRDRNVYWKTAQLLLATLNLVISKVLLSQTQIIFLSYAFSVHTGGNPACSGLTFLPWKVVRETHSCFNHANGNQRSKDKQWPVGHQALPLHVNLCPCTDNKM